MFRKRKTPTPGFRLPPPFNPMTGERMPLTAPGIGTHCAMMQVAADDEHDDYVICRGYDPLMKRFIDYDAGDLANKPGVAVAKPYGNRTAGAYEVGQVFAAVVPVTRIGENPGVAATSAGHPADLDEEVELLYDADSNAIRWLLLDTGTTSRVRFELKNGITPGGTANGHPREWDPDLAEYVTNTDVDAELELWDIDGWCRGRGRNDFASPHDAGSRGIAELRNGQWEIVELHGQAHRIRGLTTGAVAAGDASFTIDGVAVMGPPGSHITDQDPAGSVTVYKPEDQSAADNNGYCEAYWDESQDHWVCDVLECPA